jgi:hypothetical protein
MTKDERLQQIVRDVFADFSTPPREVVQQIGLLVRRWPVDAFAREKLSNTGRRLFWLDGAALGVLEYIADDVRDQQVVATIRPLSKIVHVEAKIHVGGDAIRTWYRRDVVVHFVSGDLIAVDASKCTNEIDRNHAERFIDVLLDALAERAALDE